MTITNKHYFLEIRPKTDKTEIIMNLKKREVSNTIFFPRTVEILHRSMPTVLQSKCFNDHKLLFTEEVKRTEIGHLFEHVLIDALCQEKAKLTTERVTYSGETSWDWKRFAKGSFYITISATKNEYSLLQKSLPQTITIVNSVLDS